MTKKVLCSFGKNVFERDNLICKRGDAELKLKLHGFTKIGSKGKPVFSAYGIEIVTDKNPYELKYYFDDTSVSYPNYINSPMFKNKKITKEFMKRWVKKNNKKISKFFDEYKHIN